jgi:hypothetical protein
VRQSFELQPSRILAAVLGAAHLAALASLVPLAFPAWAKAALALVILFSLRHHLRCDALLSGPSSGMALALEGAQAMLSLRGGKTLTGSLSRDSVVTPFLVVLIIVPRGVRLARSVVILPDNLGAESFRQLCVRLKWGG